MMTGWPPYQKASGNTPFYNLERVTGIVFYTDVWNCIATRSATTFIPSAIIGSTQKAFLAVATVVNPTAANAVVVDTRFATVVNVRSAFAVGMKETKK